MSTPKFTPGPWTLEVAKDSLSRSDMMIFSADGCSGIARVYRFRGGPDPGEGDANARLIAAAPEMYALLKRYYETASSLRPGEDLRACDAGARALLAKIDGDAA